LFYTLVHHPNIDLKPIKRLRRKYLRDDVAGPRLVFVPLLTEPQDDLRIINHIETVLANWQPFSASFYLRKMGDYSLALLLKEGRVESTKLQDELFTDVWSSYKADNYLLEPFLLLGIFLLPSVQIDVENFEKALAEAEQLSFDHGWLVKEFHLLKINEDLTEVIWSRRFALL
jgi:hypothetical protein